MTDQKLELMEVNGQDVWMTEQKAAVINELTATNKGQFAYLGKYTATSGRLVPETSNFIVRTRVSTMGIYEKVVFFLQNLKVEDINLDELYHTAPFEINEFVDGKVVKVQKKAEKKTEPTMKEKKEKAIIAINELMASCQKSLDGERNDARRESHDRNYLELGTGIKVHYVTEARYIEVEGQDKPKRITVPVLKDGNPVAEYIMIQGIEQGRKVLEKGVYKHVNSQLKTRIKQRIEKLYPKELKIKFFSLKENNYEVLSMGSNKVRPEDVEGSKSFTFDEIADNFGVSRKIKDFARFAREWNEMLNADPCGK